MQKILIHLLCAFKSIRAKAGSVPLIWYNIPVSDTGTNQHPHKQQVRGVLPPSAAILSSIEQRSPGEGGTRYSSSASPLVQSLSQTTSSATYLFQKMRSSLYRGIFPAHTCYGSGLCPPVSHLIALPSLQLLDTARSMAIKPYPGWVGWPGATKNSFWHGCKVLSFLPSPLSCLGGGKQR